jgi:eukaryotic-like serine/threonine-protein kinase
MLNKMLKERYQVIQQLTQGGFGITFLAEDTQRPGSPRCIVKKLQPIFEDEARLEVAKRLFQQEAEILEKLGTHSQIPQLLAYFSDNQDFYLVQEYIEGHDLSYEIPPATDKLSETEVTKLLTEIVEVLEFVHKNNVIHRDIKPSNIRRRESDGKIVLIDFGAVRQIQAFEVTRQGETKFTVPVGTPGYMPSEQAIGTPKFCSDIYAVGIICIQALTGLYFNYEGKMPRGSNGEIDWRDGIKVSPELANIIDKMVRYDHRQRHCNAIELLDEIKALQKSKKSQILKEIRQKLPLILGGLVAALGLAGLLSHLPSIFQQSTPSPKTQLSFSTYKSPEKGISLQYPDDWNQKNLKQPFTGEWVSFIAKKENQNDSFQEIITLSFKPFNGTLTESIKEVIKQIPQSENQNQNLIASSTILANRDAYQVVYMTKIQDHTLKNLRIWTLNNDQIYIITYTAKLEDYDKYLKSAEAVIKSLEIQ